MDKQEGSDEPFFEEMYLKSTEYWMEMMSIIEGDNYSVASVYLPIIPVNDYRI